MWNRARSIVCSLILALSVSLALAATNPSQAQAAGDVSLAWDPNPPAESVTGYIVFWGRTSRTAPGFTGYDYQKDVGNVLETTIPVLDETVDWYFAAKAYNAVGLQSDYSDEIKTLGMTIPGKPTWRKLFVTTPKYVAEYLPDGRIIITPR